MRKNVFLLAFVLLPWMAFAQSTDESFNKGSIKIDASYSNLMQKHLLDPYPDFRMGVGYGLADWCVAGVFGSFGIHKYDMCANGETATMIGDSIVLVYNEQDAFDGKVTEFYYHYGFSVELHPIAIWAPDFQWVDPYCRGELGMRTVTERFQPEYYGKYAEPVRHNFLFGGSLGIAINPTRRFGIFYELAIDNVNKKLDLHSHSGEIKTQPMHRFGINVRLGGPRKWQSL